MSESEETNSGKSHKESKTPGIEVQEIFDLNINASLVNAHQQSDFGKQSVHFMNQAQLQEKVYNPQDFNKVYNADKISLKLLRLIVNFYRENKAVFFITPAPIKEESKIVM